MELAHLQLPAGKRRQTLNIYLFARQARSVKGLPSIIMDIYKKISLEFTLVKCWFESPHFDL